MRKMNEYALYKGDTLLAFGTAKEIAIALNIKVTTVRQYGKPSYHRRSTENARRLIRIED